MGRTGRRLLIALLLAVLVVAVGVPLVRALGSGYTVTEGTVAGRHWKLHAGKVFGASRVCAWVEAPDLNDYPKRTEAEGEVCGWTRTTDGSGWVGDGVGAEEIPETGQWIFYGPVPADVASVRVTLAGGASVRVPTLAHRGQRGRFFVIQRQGFEPVPAVGHGGAPSLELFDAAGRPIRVY
ncbi:MAG TPA: hypothetical protein VF486_17825 [Actinomycetes bacterium]